MELHGTMKKQILNSFNKIFVWISEFHKLLDDKKVTSQTLNIVCNGIDGEMIQSNIKLLQKDVESFLKTFHDLYEYLKMETTKIFKPDLSKASFTEIKDQIQTFERSLGKLALWSQFTLRKTEMHPISKGLIQLIDDDAIDSDDLIPILKGNLADYILKEILSGEPSLRNFLAGYLQDSKIKKFRTLDKQLLKVNQRRIQQRIFGSET